MKPTILCAGLCMGAAGLCAQSHHGAAAGKPATLMPGFGAVHHPISTSNPEAQRFFDQGLALIYGFNHDEAVRAFRRAAELDPRAAMPHWGIALALGPNYNLEAEPDRQKAAFDAVQKAAALSKNATAHDRAYVDAVAKRYASDPKADVKKLSVDYKDAMHEVMRRFPDDLDAATLYAESLMNLRPWQLWMPDGKPAEGTEEVVAVLESVLRRDPDHLGANHYYVHAVEASKRPERALPSANRLMRLAPASGHLVHMPGHIFLQLGDYETTARTNDLAAAADRKYISATGAMGVYPMMYYSHNLHFIAVARAGQGRLADARRAAAQLAQNVAPGVKDMPMLAGYLTIPYTILLRFARWDEILAEPAPQPPAPPLMAFWHYMRACAFGAIGKVGDAAAERGKYREAIKQVPPDTPFGPLNTAAAVFAVASASLDARVAQAEGRKGEAVDYWRRAVAAEEKLAYDEPPAWYYPVRESLGAAMLRNGDAAGAERVFREDLQRNPRNGRSLFGLLESLKAQKKDTEAQLVRRQFEAAWKQAEVTLRIIDF
ncbi:MAG: tetratricopeptide repeat protein [Bryobacteraceae bacterium]